MKYAKSIKLGGEIIDAIDGSHDDCRLLNMVCDRCGEAVIFRQGHTRSYAKGAVEVLPVWVHRSASHVIDQSECELRVDSYTLETINKKKAEAKHQRYEALNVSLFLMYSKYTLYHAMNPNYVKADWNRYYLQVKKIAKKYTNATKNNERFLYRLSNLFLCAVRNLNVDSTGVEEVFSIMYEQTTDLLKPVLRSFHKRIYQELHNNLCGEIIAYLAHKSQKDNLSYLYFLFLQTSNMYEVLDRGLVKEGDDFEFASIHYFVYSLVLTDWYSAFNWAIAELEKNKFASGVGFGR